MARRPKRKPTFLKLLFGDFANRLRIPSKFVKDYLSGKDVPRRATLKSDMGKSWSVGVRKVDQGQGHVIFGGVGWSDFVKDHRLTHWDSILFTMLDSSTFEFDAVIYDLSATPKPIPLPPSTSTSTSKRRRRRRRRGGRPSSSTQNAETPIISRKGRPKKATTSSRHLLSGGSRNNNGGVVEVGSEEALESASWELVLKPYQHHNVSVRAGFARKSGLKWAGETVIKDAEDRLWGVKVWKSGPQVCLSTGWSKFLEGNGILAGDKLLFRFIPNTAGNHQIHAHIVEKAGDDQSRRQQLLAFANSSSRRRRGRRPSTSIKLTSQSVRRGSDEGEQIEIISETTPEDHPSFHKVFKQHNKYCVVVPGRFADRVGMRNKQKRSVKTPDGKMWELSVVVDANGQVRLSSGWATFRRENRLGIGDILFFDYFAHQGNQIQVRIDRKAGYKTKRSKNIY